MKSTSCIKKSVKKIVKKTPNKIPYTMKIHNSLEHIRESELKKLSLFELSIRSNMPNDIYRELKRRIEIIQKQLNLWNVPIALHLVNKLLIKP